MKPYSFLAIHTTLAPDDNRLHFRKNLFKRIYILIMTIDDKIRNEKLQYDINREAGKISALSSGKINKYKYLTSKEILPSDQSRMTEQARFPYFPLKKAFEKQIKKIENLGEKQIKAIEEHGKELAKSNAFVEKDSLPPSKQDVL